MKSTKNKINRANKIFVAVLIPFIAIAVLVAVSARSPINTNILLAVAPSPFDNGETAVFTLTIVGSEAEDSGAGEHIAGEEVSINAGTREGYTFNNWTADYEITFDNAENAATTFVMPESDLIITANWTATPLPPPAGFTVTVEGSSLPAGTGEGQSGAGVYQAGDTVTINAGTRANATFTRWNVTAGAGVIFANELQSPTTFTMPSSDVTVVAQFTETPPLTGIVLATRDNIGVYRPILAPLDFGVRRPGYTPVASVAIGIFNQTDNSTGEAIATLSGADASSFILGGGIGTSSSVRNVPNTAAHSSRSDAFTIMPATNLPARQQPYTATVTLSTATGNNFLASFQVQFLVSTDAFLGTYTLTLNTSFGGLVALGNSGFGSSITGNFAPGEHITISAAPNSNFEFDVWSFNFGTVANQWNPTTTFIMPNQDTTVIARFFDTRNIPWQTPVATPPPTPSPTPLPTPGIYASPIPTPAPIQPGIPLPDPVLPTLPDPEPILPIPPEPPAPVIHSFLPLTVNINGMEQSMPQPAAMVNGIPMIPVGGILRALDFGANWDEDNRVATLNRFNREIIIRDGEQSFTINGVMRHLPAPVIIVEGHMMVPFVEFIDAIGGRSNLDTNNTINIFITR